MARHYLLSATGPDRPGIVAAVTKLLFESGCNLEDSSMTRLGSEFAILVFFTAPGAFSSASSGLDKLAKKWRLTVGCKPIKAGAARFSPTKAGAVLVSVHGADRPGLVYQVTAALARHRFNVTDLFTHRTTAGRRAGYILFVEGELPARLSLSRVAAELRRLGEGLGTSIDVRHVAQQTL